MHMLKKMSSLNIFYHIDFFLEQNLDTQNFFLLK